jgi:sulfoxide reductase catalytic subunit YedY
VLIRRAPDVPSSEITPESLYLNRRSFMAAASFAALNVAWPAARLLPRGRRDSDKPNSFQDITH